MTDIAPLAEGATAPEFRLPAVQDNQAYSLETLLSGRRGLALLFMRGTW